MRNVSRMSLVFSVMALASSTAMAASIFNFDTDAAGKGTAFTDTNNGISATFSSSGDPNGFVVEDPTVFGVSFSTLTGNVLIDDLANTKSNLTLTILFSSTVSNVSMNFVVQNTAPTPFLLRAFSNGTAVGSVTATDSVPSGFVFAEGVASFSSTSFNEIILSSSANAFAVDNITVNSATAAPEPGMFLPLASLVLLPVFPAVRRKLFRS